jgi:hypothetical protein
MSGRRDFDQQPGGQPLGEKIKAELLSALKLLFKSAEQHAVNLALPDGLTIYATDIEGRSESVSIAPPQPLVSEDPIQCMQRRKVPTRRLTLLESTTLAAGAPCTWEPVLCNEPGLDAMQFESAGVKFDNMKITRAAAWPVTSPPVKIEKQPIGKLAAPLVKNVMDAQPLVTKSRSLLDTMSQVNVKHNARYYALPIRKASIPPHRFSLAMRERFRQALAEKAGTHEGNVQLKMIFERMNMGLFSAIQADESGSLMCTPKGELLGRNAETLAGQALLRQLSVGSEASYLVLGVRLDHKTDIRALVPVESLMEPFSDGEPRA